MPALEVNLGFQWLESTLSNDATLKSLAPGGVWRALAPPGTATPFVVFGLQSGSDVVTMNGYRVMDDLLYMVKVAGPASNTSAIAQAAERVDQLIGSPPTSGTVTGGAILASYGQTPLFIDEIVNGELWTNAGRLYRLIIEQTS